MLPVSWTVQLVVLDDPEKELRISRKAVQKTRPLRRSFTEKFKREEVAILLDGHSAPEGLARTI